MLLGEHCCFDLRGSLAGWETGQPDWSKKCCDNRAAPVIQPADGTSPQQLQKVSQLGGRPVETLQLI